MLLHRVIIDPLFNVERHSLAFRCAELFWSTPGEPEEFYAIRTVMDSGYKLACCIHDFLGPNNSAANSDGRNVRAPPNCGRGAFSQLRAFGPPAIGIVTGDQHEPSQRGSSWHAFESRYTAVQRLHSVWECMTCLTHEAFDLLKV